MNFLNALKSVVISIKDWVNAKLRERDNAIATAQRVGDNAQSNIRALEIKVGDLPNGSNVSTIVDYIDEKTKNAGSGVDIVALTNRVATTETEIATIEADYLKNADKSELENKIEASKQEAINTVLGETIHADFDTLQEVAEWIQNDTTNSVDLINRISTIEGDYLKQADKEALSSDIQGTLNSVAELTAQVDGIDEHVGEIKNTKAPLGDPLIIYLRTPSYNYTQTFSKVSGATHIDWGDGSALEDVSAATTYEHYYTNQATYKISFYGNITSPNVAFSRNANITQVEMPNTITIIGSFTGCTSLAHLVLSNRIYALTESCLNGCTSLKHLEIPDGIKELQNYALQSSGVISVKLPSTLQKISLQAFYNTNLEQVELLGTPPTIGGAVFPSKTKIIVPSRYINDYKTAEGWTRYASQIDACAPQSGLDDVSTRIDVIEKTLSGNLLSTPIAIAEIWNSTQAPIVVDSLGVEIGKTYKVTGYYGIEKVPFEYTANTTSGPEDFMPIPEGASYTRLVEVSGSGDTETDSYYFAVDLIDCSEFTGSEIIYNAEMALLACTAASGVDTVYDNIRDVVIESIIEAKPEYATKEEVEAVDVRVGELDVKTSGEPLIARFSIPSKSTGEGTTIEVSRITGATHVDWGDGSPIEDITGITTYSHLYETPGWYYAKFYGYISSVGGSAFYDCDELDSVVIPSTVSSMGYSVFYKCDKLTKVAIPNSVCSMSYSVFSNCGSLTSVVIPDTVTSIGEYMFSSCSKLTGITIPKSATQIGKNAFYSCVKLADITIPSAVTSIGEQAFYCCYALKDVTVGSNVASIGQRAFSAIASNATIEFLGDVPALTGDYHFRSDTQIIVPYEYLNNYKTAEGWSQYADQIIANTPSSVVEALENRLTTLEEGAGGASNLLSEPVVVSEWTSQEVTYNGASIGLKAGSTYKVSGTMGTDNTPWEFVATTTSSESAGLEPGAVLLAQEEAINDVAIAIYDGLDLATGAPVIDNSNCYYAFGCANASDANTPYTIESIAEVEEEYATVSYVDSLIAEINNKLEALYGGTEV